MSRLHELEHGAAFESDLPAAAFALDETLREDVEVRHGRRRLKLYISAVAPNLSRR
jgi:hypothetical protein